MLYVEIWKRWLMEDRTAGKMYGSDRKLIQISRQKKPSGAFSVLKKIGVTEAVKPMRVYLSNKRRISRLSVCAGGR